MEDANNVSLNDYFDNISLQDKVVFVAACDESSKMMSKITSPNLKCISSSNISYRQALIGIIDYSTGVQDITIGDKEIEMNYTLSNSALNMTTEVHIVSGGYNSSIYKNGVAFFVIDGTKHELVCNRGLNFLIVSKKKLAVMDCFSVDTFADSSLKIRRWTAKSLLESLQEDNTSAIEDYYRYSSRLNAMYSYEILYPVLEKLSVKDLRFLPILLDIEIAHAKKEQRSIIEHISLLQKSTQKPFVSKGYAHLARLYADGFIVSKNIEYAADLFEKASEYDSTYRKEQAIMLSKSRDESQRLKGLKIAYEINDATVEYRILRSLPHTVLPNGINVIDCFEKALDMNSSVIDDYLAYMLHHKQKINYDKLYNVVLNKELDRKKIISDKKGAELSAPFQEKIMRLSSEFKSFYSALKLKTAVNIVCNTEFVIDDLKFNNCEKIKDNDDGNAIIICLIGDDNGYPLELSGKRFLSPLFVYEWCLAEGVGTFCCNNGISIMMEELPRIGRTLFSTKDQAVMESLSFPGFNMYTQKQYVSECYKDHPESREFVLSGKWVKVHNNGAHNILVDDKSKFLNITNGRRYTTGNTSEWKNTVYFFGPCVVRGLYVDDSGTIPSLFQEKSKIIEPNRTRTINCGVDGFGSYHDMEYILSTFFRSGDCIFIINWFSPLVKLILSRYGASYEDLSIFFSSESNYQGYYLKDETHFSKLGNEKLAHHLLELYYARGNINSCQKSLISYGLNRYMTDIPGINEYVSTISKYRQKQAKTIGSIVMNCNPFTLGHLHLVEYAASNVDHLYIFVVEEDKSFFKFEDRLDLAIKCTSHLNNVTVLKSGNFIISQKTFAQYFDKEKDKNAFIDASTDLNIFANLISPALNISVRFVGEEPNDNVTHQYNEQMKELLPMYGIKLVEIPRKKINKSFISASYVRKMINEKKWDAIKQCVPRPTYEFIMSHYT